MLGVLRLGKLRQLSIQAVNRRLNGPLSFEQTHLVQGQAQYIAHISRQEKHPADMTRKVGRVFKFVVMFVRQTCSRKYLVGQTKKKSPSWLE